MPEHQLHLRESPFYVFDEGSGPPLLLVHGFPLDHSMWRHQIEAFRRTHRVIAPDLRGFGRSGASSGKVSMQQFADDLFEIVERLGESRPVTLCALSMGGYVAWQFFERHRHQLAALILCDTRAAPDSAEAVRGRLELAEKLEQEGIDVLADSMLPKLFGDRLVKDRPEYVQETVDVILRTDPRSCAAALRGMAEREDYRPKLGGIDIPTLVVCGERDAISPPSEAREMAAAIPGAIYFEVPRAHHMAPLESPEPVNRAIGEFLAMH